MKILERSQQILICASLGTSPTVHIGEKVIPRELIRIAIASMHLVCSIFGTILCFRDSESGIATMLLSIHISCTYFSGLLIYISLMLKTGEIVEVIEFLQRTIARRN